MIPKMRWMGDSYYAQNGVNGSFLDPKVGKHDRLGFLKKVFVMPKML